MMCADPYFVKINLKSDVIMCTTVPHFKMLSKSKYSI